VKNSSSYNPLYSAIYERLFKPETVKNYGSTTKNPFATFIDDSGYNNVLWYEDTRSIQEKIRSCQIIWN